MPPDTPLSKNERLALLMAVLVLSFNVFLTGCTRIVYRDAPTPYVVVPDTIFSPCGNGGLCTIATAYCSEDNRPIVFLRQGHNEGEQKLYTKVHEEIHIAQMKADCKGTQQRYRDSLTVREKMEAEAYCAEARSRYRRHQNIEMAVSWYAQIMFAIFETDRLQCQLKPP